MDILDIDQVRVVQRISGATVVGTVAEDQRRMIGDALLTPGGMLKSGGLKPQRRPVEAREGVLRILIYR